MGISLKPTLIPSTNTEHGIFSILPIDTGNPKSKGQPDSSALSVCSKLSRIDPL